MPKKTRKRFTAQEKVAILRLHLLEQTPISDLWDQHGIHPTMFYRWQKEFFENAAAAFEPRGRRAGDAKDRRITFLEQKLPSKNQVLSELMEEPIKLKKLRWQTWVEKSKFPGGLSLIRGIPSRRRGVFAGKKLLSTQVCQPRKKRWCPRQSERQAQIVGIQGVVARNLTRRKPFQLRWLHPVFHLPGAPPNRGRHGSRAGGAAGRVIAMGS
jgi:transposase